MTGSARPAEGAAAARPGPLAAHDNNFGAVRLFLAMLVVFGHSWPLARGWRDAGAWGRLAVAPHELAVDGFFLLSGCLITASVMRSGTAAYLRRRIGRIYPGFAVAYLLSVGLALLAGGALAGPPWQDVLRHGAAIVRLAQPQLAHPYPGNPFEVANGSLWTCAYEFACYLLVLALDRLGVLRRRALLLGATAMLLAAGTWSAASGVWWFHKLANPFRLGGLFLAGGLFHLYRERIAFGGGRVPTAAAGLLLALLSHWTALAGVALGGGLLLFGAGFAGGPAWLREIGRRRDISFGVYLYAWPIQSLLVWWLPGIGPWRLCLLAAPAAAAAGWLSWTLVERHFVRQPPPAARPRG